MARKNKAKHINVAVLGQRVEPKIKIGDEELKCAAHR